MAKTIKFNLICNDTPVRTIEDLQDNFSIEDVLTYYRNGLLQRWLEVRGYEKELKKVIDIKGKDSLGIIKELINIFGVVSDKKKIEEGVYMIEFLDEQKKRCSLYEQNRFKTKSIIDDYQAGYARLVLGILYNPDDVARIKANIEEMVTNYKWALDLNHRGLFWELYDNRYLLAIMCLLMNDKTRDYFMPVELMEISDSELIEKVDALGGYIPLGRLKKGINSAAGWSYTPSTGMHLIGSSASGSTATSIASPTEKKYDIYENLDKYEMYTAICDMPKASDFADKLGDNLVRFAGVTDGYWKDLESKGKKYMIISMGDGDYVRSAGKSGGDLSSADVTNKFLVVDGIDYKSNSVSRELLYMEV